MTMPGGTELIIILFIVLLLFGARRLPDLAGSIGRSVKEFRKATVEEAGTDRNGSDGTDASGTTEIEGSGGPDDRA
jgi:sec-independent protein translocase protein TatA